MNRKQLTLVVVLGLILGGLGWWVARRDAASFQTTGPSLGQKLLPNFPLNDVAQLTIREGTNELHLVKEQDQWKVRERYGYPANYTEVGDLIRKMWDMKVVQSEAVGPSQLPRLQLLDPGSGTNSGTRVEFKDGGGKSLASVLLGKKHMRRSESASPMGGEGWPDGRWVLATAGAQQAALISEAFTEVEPKPDRWLNKTDFLKVEKLKSIEVTHTNATNSWKLYRETENGELKLADAKEGEKLDTGKASPAGYALSSPSFNDVVSPEAKPEETGLEHPVVARLETFDGFTYTAKLGKKTTDDNYYFTVAVSADLPKERTPGKDEKAEDKDKLDKEFKEKLGKQQDKLKQEEACAKWTYLVSRWTVDPLLKERKDFFADKKDDKAAAAKPGETTPGDVKPGEPDQDEPPMPGASDESDESDDSPGEPK